MTAAQLWLAWEIGVSAISRLHVNRAKRKLAKQRQEELINAFKNFDNLTDAELDSIRLRGKKQKNS